MPQLTIEQKIRYERHVRLPEVKEAGQIKLLQSKVLLIGAGGLGSPVALYLAAAGVGTLGVVDFDSVSLSNLQRQIIHSTVGKLKVPSVTEAVTRLTPDVSTVEYVGRVDASTIDQIFEIGWHVVIDAVDNLETRYLINEACVKRKLPWIHGAVFSYEGQVTTFTRGGPCYRCLYPDVPPKGADKPGGVLGVVPGVIGTIQATEALKVILGLGQTLEGTMLNYNALYMSFDRMPLGARNPNCSVCSMTY